MKKELENLVGQEIVVDTATSWVYIGRLERIGPDAIHLADADAHDNSDTATSKERYILDSRRTGIKSNRKQVIVSLGFIVSVSPLSEIREF